MEEKMIDQENNVQNTAVNVAEETVTPTNSSTTAGNAPAKGVFNQEQLDEILQGRLAKEKKKYTSELEHREALLKEKEAKINELSESKLETEKRLSSLEYSFKKQKVLSLAKQNQLDLASLNQEDIETFVNSSSDIFDEDGALKVRDNYLKKKFPNLKYSDGISTENTVNIKKTETSPKNEEDFSAQYLKALQGGK
jgi:hypothetical protein